MWCSDASHCKGVSELLRGPAEACILLLRYTFIADERNESSLRRRLFIFHINMLSLFGILVGAVLLVCVLTYQYVVQPAFISSLSKLPSAHPLCSITSKWFDRQRDNGREVKTLFAAHETYGSIVRVGPQEVSVASLEGLRHIYTAGMIKHPWYKAKFENYETPNLVSMLDHRTHSVQKRMITSVYAKSYVQRSTDAAVLSERILFQKFLPLVKEYARSEKPVNVMDPFRSAGIDFMTAYIFGTAHSTNFLQDDRTRDAYFAEWFRIRDFDEVGEKNLVEGTVMGLLEGALADQSDYTAAEETKPVVFSVLYAQILDKAKAEGRDMSQTELKKRCASEVLDHIIAAHDTFAITLTYAVHRLSLDPAMQATLREELLALDPTVAAEANRDNLPQADQIDRLPLLNGILQETLRLYAAVPGRQPRVVPPGGIMLHDHFIPAGTTVSCNAYNLHRHSDTFPQRFEWIPQRWMPRADRSKETADFPTPEEARRWFWAFGSGGRMYVQDPVRASEDRLLTLSFCQVHRLEFCIARYGRLLRTDESFADLCSSQTAHCVHLYQLYDEHYRRRRHRTI